MVITVSFVFLGNVMIDLRHTATIQIEHKD